MALGNSGTDSDSGCRRSNGTELCTETEGSLNLPTRIAHRHPDFLAVITTNRGYNGYRPLNEALRDRVQHAEKLDLPPKAVMMERGKAKTGYKGENVLSLLAETIILLDETARANAIKGVAGMRSYIFWVDAVASGEPVRSTLYHKVLYKITTDPQELAILEQALESHGLTDKLAELNTDCHSHPEGENPEVMELHISENGEYSGETDRADKQISRIAATLTKFGFMSVLPAEIFLLAQEVPLSSVAEEN